MNRKPVSTDQAPAAIGTYSQAVRHGDVVYLSGQIPLDPATMQLVDENIEAQIRQVFNNLSAVCQASGGGLDNILKLTVFLVDMANFPQVNSIMAEFFSEPFPARAAIGVASLPRGAGVEMDAILGL